MIGFAGAGGLNYAHVYRTSVVALAAVVRMFIDTSSLTGWGGGGRLWYVHASTLLRLLQGGHGRGD